MASYKDKLYEEARKAMVAFRAMSEEDRKIVLTLGSWGESLQKAMVAFDGCELSDGDKAKIAKAETKISAEAEKADKKKRPAKATFASAAGKLTLTDPLEYAQQITTLQQAYAESVAKIESDLEEKIKAEREIVKSLQGKADDLAMTALLTALSLSATTTVTHAGQNRISLDKTSGSFWVNPPATKRKYGYSCATGSIFVLSEDSKSFEPTGVNDLFFSSRTTVVQACKVFDRDGKAGLLAKISDNTLSKEKAGGVGSATRPLIGPLPAEGWPNLP